MSRMLKRCPRYDSTGFLRSLLVCIIAGLVLAYFI
jgi:hypothetical protein